jgi:hypothetical protein
MGAEAQPIEVRELGCLVPPAFEFLSGRMP